MLLFFVIIQIERTFLFTMDYHKTEFNLPSVCGLVCGGGCGALLDEGRFISVAVDCMDPDGGTCTPPAPVATVCIDEAPGPDVAVVELSVTDRNVALVDKSIVVELWTIALAEKTDKIFVTWVHRASLLRIFTVFLHMTLARPPKRETCFLTAVVKYDRFF